MNKQPSAFSYRLSAGGHRWTAPHGPFQSAFRNPQSAIRNAFTLLELMIVIGIIGLLLTLVLPIATRLIANTKINSTKATMQVIENALDRYEHDAPLVTPQFGKLPPPSFSTNERITPLNETFTDTNLNGMWDWVLPEAIQNDDGNGRFDTVYIRDVIAGISKQNTFTVIIRSSASPPDPQGPEQYHTTDYLSIESLYLFISQLSPQGKAILSKLPNSVLTNKDQCGGSPCTDVLVLDSNRNDTNDATDARIDLFEIRDAWGVSIRYDVHFLPLDSTGVTRFGWELRSAGPDGKFAAMFTPEDQSGDDVILSGQ